MTAALVIAEHADGRISETAASLVTAASSISSDVVLGLIARDPDSLLTQCGFAGVTQILCVAADANDTEAYAAALRALIDDVRPRAVLMPYSIRAASVAAGVAESLDLGFASDVVALSADSTGELLVERPVYGGKIQAEIVLSADAPALLLLRSDRWAAAAAGDSPAPRRLPAPPSVAPRIRHREFVRPEAGIDLTQAPVIFALGRGVGEQENIATFETIAQRLNVALGASRPLVSAGWMSQPQQVGQTGVTVKPRLYVAFGISGAQQHLAGMQASQTIVAVNTDKDASIFDFSDVGAVADIHEVAKALLARTED